MKTESVEECHDMCVRTPNCTLFTYITEDFTYVTKMGEDFGEIWRKSCCLKYGSIGDWEEKAGVISGVMTCPGNLSLNEYLSVCIY